MHDRRDEQGTHPAGTDEEDAMGRILSLAGRRPEVMAEIRADIKRAAYPAWQHKVQEHAAQARARSYRWLAVAALLTVAMGLILFRALQPTTPATAVSPPTLATLEALLGAVHVGAEVVTIGDAVTAGAVVTTGADALASLRLASGAALRLDAGSRLVLRDAQSIVLEQGAVYFDSGPQVGDSGPLASTGRAVAVHTPFGVVHDIGTQFEVRVEPAGLRVQVREGAVRLDREAHSHTASAGTALLVDVAGDVAQRAIEPHGAAWAWVLRAAPSFELEGRPLADFLTWVSRETGWRLRYVDPQLAADVAAIIAHGSIADLQPDQALDLVLPTSGLVYRVEGDTLVITRP